MELVMKLKCEDEGMFVFCQGFDCTVETNQYSLMQIHACVSYDHRNKVAQHVRVVFLWTLFFLRKELGLVFDICAWC
jgi:hypothetical protein